MSRPSDSVRLSADHPDARRVRRAFGRASATFDAAAVLQRETREILIRRLELTTLDPKLILDVGAATGHGSKQLKRRYPKARVVAIDSAGAMLHESRRQQAPWRRFDRVCADAGQLPLADASVDLIFSNLMLPWCDPDSVLPEFRRVLAPRGLLSLSSFGPDTLKELRAAWAAADSFEHVHVFVDMHDLGDALVRAGFAAPVLDVDRYTLTYADALALMRDLKRIGAHNLTAGRPRSLTGKGKLEAVSAAYEQFRRGGRLPATYEVVFANAWAPTEAPARNPERESGVSLEELRAQLAKRRNG